MQYNKFVKIEKFEELYPLENVYSIHSGGGYLPIDYKVSIGALIVDLRNGKLFKKVETPWWENIPESGMLVWVDVGEGERWLRKVTKHHKKDSQIQSTAGKILTGDVVECETGFWNVKICTPLTSDEIKQFLKGE